MAYATSEWRNKQTRKVLEVREQRRCGEDHMKRRRNKKRTKFQSSCCIVLPVTVHLQVVTTFHGLQNHATDGCISERRGWEAGRDYPRIYMHIFRTHGQILVLGRPEERKG